MEVQPLPEDHDGRLDEVMVQQHPLLLKPKKKECYSFDLMYDLDCHTMQSSS